MRAVAIALLAATACVGTIEAPGSQGDAGVDSADPCEDVPALGVCEDGSFVSCATGERVVDDCAEAGLSCGIPAGATGPACATECELAGVGDAPTCQDSQTLAACDGGRVIATPCSADTRCLAGSAGAACTTAADACVGIGPQGRCDGDVLTRCDDAWPTRVDCAASQSMCGYQSDAAGYQCAGADTLGASRVTGTVRYEDRAIAPGVWGPPTPTAARGVAVFLLRDADDATLAYAVTADDGSFTLRHDAASGELVHVTAATRSAVASRPLRVQRNGGNAHAMASESFAAAPDAEATVLATEASTTGPAFNIFDTIVGGLDYTRALGATTIAPLTVEWHDGDAGGSYYDGSSNYLHIAGGADNDGYDDIVVLHEFGHYHQDEYGASDNPGGPHPSAGGDTPRLAWGEGQATYIATAISGVPHYIDYSPGGGWSVDMERDVRVGSMSGGMSQYIYEWMVAQLMWDVGDSPEQDLDGDPVSGTHDDALRVTMSYFHSADYAGRGSTGVDLVDWLDGWFHITGTPTCAAMRTLVHSWYQFPYDFAGPTPCP